MAKRSRRTTSQTIALWVLKVDAAATFAVLGLCGLSIVRSFEGAQIGRASCRERV